jgi:ribonuclease D
VRVGLAELSEKLQLPVENLLTPDFARQLCWEPPTPLDKGNIENQLRSMGARKWQIEVTSEVLVGALQAKPKTTAEAPESE